MSVSLLKFDSRLNATFFTGATTTSLVPAKFPVAIDGHPYQLEWNKEAIEVWGARYKSNALPLLRGQADQSNTPGEQSISPENWWRRSQESWIYGAGQSQQDRKGQSDTRYNSVESRFYTSKGCNPWTAYQLSLLNGTTQKRSSINSNLQIVINGTTVYMIDGGVLYYSNDGALNTWTAVAGYAGTCNSICSDGTTAYLATTTAIYTVSAGAATSYVTSPADIVAYVKGRLMAIVGTAMYNLTASGSLPTALITKATGFNWVGFAGGQSMIYGAGYSGDKSSVWRVTIQSDGTTLTPPVNAGDLPSGEIVRSIYSYQQFIVLGSDLGVRFCSVASDGSLNIGSLIPTTSPVYCFEGQDRFIWYGLSNYDSVSTGLGRMDTSTFLPNATLAPAYASDLMAGVTSSPVQGTVRSVGTYAGARIFTVDGSGLYSETLGVPVATGVMTTGGIGYNLIDPKVALFLDISHLPLNGTISAAIAGDDGVFKTVGTSSSQGTSSPGFAFQTNQKAGLQFQIRITMTPTANVSPRLTRMTLRSYPTPTRSTQFSVPILLAPSVTDKAGNATFVDVESELKHLRSLLSSQQVVDYQEGKEVYQVIMFDYQFLPQGIDKKTGFLYGIFLAILNQVTS